MSVMKQASNNLSEVHQRLYNIRHALAEEMAHYIQHGNLNRAERIWDAIHTVTQMYNLVASAQESLELAQR